MLDDETAKIRRNLVTFCAAILGCFYLDISIYDIFVQFGFGKLNTTVSPSKLIVVSIIVFVYLFWRWVTGAEQKKQFKEIIGRFESKGGDLIYAWIMHMSSQRKFGGAIDFSDDYSRESFDDWWKQVSSRFKPDGKFDISPHSGTHYSFVGQWKMQFIFEYLDGEKSRPIFVELKFFVPLWHRVRIRFFSFCHVIWQSEFWEWAPPVFLSFFAVVVLIYKAVMNTFSSSFTVGGLYCA